MSDGPEVALNWLFLLSYLTRFANSFVAVGRSLAPRGPLLCCPVRTNARNRCTLLCADWKPHLRAACDGGAGALQASYEGLTAEVFCKVLKGLSGAKVTRPGNYHSANQKKAVRCSLKADDGYANRS